MSNSPLLFQQPLLYPLLTGTSTLAVSLVEVKQQLRITDTSDDDLLTMYILGATTYFENITGRDLINKSYKTYLNNFPNNSKSYWAPYSYYNGCGDGGIRILKSKLQSITKIEYYVSGVLVTLDPATYYITDSDDYAAIYLADGYNWPTEFDTRQQAIVITFVAGYGAAESSIPQDIRNILLQMVTYLYENRGDCGGDCSKISPAIQAMITARIIMWLGNV